ncbi:YchJ family metal-binding protein [Vibrio rumoiensis]|uniref:YchJ family metal-binding protein n=1 Tax=Vibrio rumoiensis TaxID=76258 RepID=UPI000B5C3612|nr:YchJ family metal-binding protein [Vibrio rumoiensis]
MLCPCCSQQPYDQCCQPIHADTANAQLPVQLMRARYCAHVLNNVGFVINSYHSSCQAEQEAEAIAESVASQWEQLEVIDSPPPSNNEGFVEFKAYFKEDGKQYCLHERSRFIKENDQWRYIDGVMPEEIVDPRLYQTIENTKIGRNDPCLCGSGKKFKKCCG